jgi:hypothetical protein
MTAFESSWIFLKYSNVNAPHFDPTNPMTYEQQAAMIDSMLTYGTAQPPAVAQQRQYPQYTPELYNALMSLQQPNDQSKAISRD